MQDHDRIAKLLGESNLPVNVVASVVGCDHSYISILMADEAFRNRVTEMRIKAVAKNNDRDNKIDSIEDELLDKAKELLPYVMKPRDVFSLWLMTNKAVRRGTQTVAPTNITNNVVQLILPPVIAHKYIKNVHGEVIEVDGQTLVTMPSTQLLKNLSTTVENKDGAENVYERAAKHLPTRQAEVDRVAIEAGKR